MSIGLLRAGPLGMLAAWVGFTLPSALLMLAFAYGVEALGDVSNAAWLKGLKLVAVAVVAQAVWGMAQSLAPDRPRATLAVAAALIALAVPSSFGQIAAIVLGAIVGLTLLPKPAAHRRPRPCAIRPDPASRRRCASAIILFFALLLFLPPLAATIDSQALRLFDAFYRAGALVFGGGHVVLPLLQAAVVPTGWVSNDAFLAGYGAAQAMPGPLFTFAAYLGAVMIPPPNGALGALLAVVAIFAPSFLLVTGLMPFWDTLRQRQTMQSMLRGVNAAVVGVLLAALYTPVWTASVHSPAGFGLALARLPRAHILGGVAVDRRGGRRAGGGRPWRRSASGCDQPGIFGKRFMSPPRCTQDCALSQKISIAGFTQLASSSVPAPSITTSGSAVRFIGNGRAAFRAELSDRSTCRCRRSCCTGELAFDASAPASARRPPMENALPVNFWQSVQWQTPTKAGSPRRTVADLAAKTAAGDLRHGRSPLVLDARHAATAACVSAIRPTARSAR